jgi:hypothetical protein
VNLAWDTLTVTATSLAEFPFELRLSFDSANQRYNLTSVYVLPQVSPWVVEPGNRLKFEPRAMIGELRGWTSDGQSILGIQSYESDSIDAWATSLATGQSVPLTDHAEYTDPMFMSPNGKWLIAEEVAGSGRLDWISGMEGIPTITDQLPTTGYVSQIRNNSNRRFFLPWLVNPARSQSEQINAGGDPNWTAAADPVWLADSTAVVWAENLACGANPAPHQCPDSTEPGGSQQPGHDRPLPDAAAEYAVSAGPNLRHGALGHPVPARTTAGHTVTYPHRHLCDRWQRARYSHRDDHR